MKNQILVTIILCGNLLYGQTKKIGINKTTDITETLDVKGDMRIADTGIPDVRAVPLSVNEKGKVIAHVKNTGNTSNFIFKNIRLKIAVNRRRQKSTTEISRREITGVDSRKYLAVVTQASLVKDRRTLDAESGVLLKTSVVRPSESRVPKGVVKFKDGEVVNEGGNRYYTDKGDDGPNFQGLYHLGAPTPEVSLEERNGRYFISATYKGTELLEEDQRYRWYIDVLLIDKNWVKIGR